MRRRKSVSRYSLVSMMTAKAVAIIGVITAALTPVVIWHPTTLPPAAVTLRPSNSERLGGSLSLDARQSRRFVPAAFSLRGWPRVSSAHAGHYGMPLLNGPRFTGLTPAVAIRAHSSVGRAADS